MPGGCDFGVRPIDQHIKGFSAMGTPRWRWRTALSMPPPASGRLHGAQHLSGCGQSVGATMNIMLAAVLADGHDHHRKRRQGAPHRGPGQLPQLHGRRHHGARAPTSSRSTGVEQLPRRQLLHHSRPDRGGHLHGRRGRRRRRGAASRTSSPSIWTASPPSWWRWAWRWRRMDDAVHRSPRRQAAPAPMSRPCPTRAFPPTCSPRLPPCCAWPRAPASSPKGVWDNRYRYVDEFRRMGANIQVDGKVAVIEGVESPHRRPGAVPATCGPGRL